MNNVQLHYEKLRGGFEKLNFTGLPFEASVHHITEPDSAESIHDHPFAFSSFIMHGWYRERIYHLTNSAFWKKCGGYWYQDVYRGAGSSHYVQAECIHQIIEVSEGGCFTLVTPSAHSRKSRFYRFEERRILSRAWDEIDFTEHKNQ